VYHRMSSFVSQTTTTLLESAKAAEEIDRCLRSMAADPSLIGSDILTSA
jgi:TPP-dependent 2-oxoacid decarboxylase